jgi:hypothetical protein
LGRHQMETKAKVGLAVSRSSALKRSGAVLG